MNSRLLISQSKKAGAMIINPIPVMVGGQIFPSEIDQINSGKHKQNSSDNESAVPFHLKWFRLFYFLKNI